MKANAKPTFEDVATALCKGTVPPEWVIAKLRKYAAFVADTAPKWSAHLSDHRVRNVWSCDACGYQFEDAVYLPPAS
jgi:hypothetical protein